MADRADLQHPAQQRAKPLAVRIWDGLIGSMNAAGSFWILLLMILIVADVIGRNLLGKPVRGAPEIVGLSIVGIVFIQLAYAVRSGKLTRSDAILARLVRSRPAFGYTMDALFHLLGAFIFSVIVYAGLPLLVRSWNSGDYAGVAGYFTVPTWPLKLIIVVGSTCAALEFLRASLRLLRQAAFPKSRQTS